ncbi:MAG TPA: gamma-glutamyltransferase [Burkholderiaceae bacterium]
MNPSRLQAPRRGARTALAAATIAALLAAALPTPVLAQLAPNASTGVVRYDLVNEIFHPVHTQHGMVASESYLASQVGVDVLRKGGNAVDAAVATAFALAVTLPNAGNLGGGGFMMLHDAKTGKDTAIDFREMAPGRASRNMYLDDKGDVIPDKSLFTQAAIGVPGTVAGMMYALEHYGTKKRAELIAPAIALARKGFPVDEQLAVTLDAEQKHLGAWDSSKKIFFKDGRPLRTGEILRNDDLANSMALISRDGARAFYEGPIGKAIVAEAKAHDGLITMADLKNYKVVERVPVRGSYRGYEIVSMPPPSSGGVHIVQILNMLSAFPLKEWGFNSAKTIHAEAEAMKLAYADRSEYLGDPDFVKVPVKGLTSPAYAAELVKKIDPDKATPSATIKPGKPQPYESDQTTQFTIADAQGNVVSVTYTLNTSFGSGIVATGTGILLNNEMDDFSAKPGVPNAYGLVGGDANAVGPMKRPLSSMSPTIVLKDGKPWLATGSPGGARIITTTLQVIVDMIDFGMNPAEASSAVRIHHQWLPDELRIEKGLSPDTIALLTGMGYKVVERPAMGRTQTIEMTPAGFFGYSDPRNPNGATLGY